MGNKSKIDRKNRKLQKAQAFLNLVKNSPDSQSNPKSSDLIRQEQHQYMADTPKQIACSEKQIETENHSEDGKKAEKQKYSAEEYEAIKRSMKERSKLAMQRPKVFLTPDDMLPYKIENGDNIKPPLFTVDLQQLLLFAVQGNICSQKPRWCKLLRVTKVSSVVFVCLDSVAYSDFTSNRKNFCFISQSFESHTEVVCPAQYGGSVDDEIVTVPTSISQIKKANVKVEDKVRKQVADMIRPSSNSSIDSSTSFSSGSKDKFSRVCLLLSTDLMKTEGYPLPVKTTEGQYKHFSYTKDHYMQVTTESPLFAVDCEMCLTTIHRNELTRVSIVAENGDLIYDTLVKPRNKIINYLTKFSGITKAMLDPVDVRLEDVQAKIKEILPPDAILCGQSLNCDLLALQLFHPYIIDTSIIFNMSGSRKTKAGLRKLTGFFLNRTIQNNSAGHCSAEDARATMDLVKLKLQKGLEFGDATISGIYFPSISTYFLGNENGNKGKVENVEEEAERDRCQTGNSLKRGLESDSSRPEPKRVKSEHMENKDLMLPNQKAVFHQKKTHPLFRSFFKLLEEAGRTGTLIGREALTKKYEADPIEVVPVLSDKQAYKATKDAVNDKFFTWVNFNKFREMGLEAEASQDSVESIFQKLDKRVGKIVTRAKDHSLIVVMMTGREVEGELTNAGVFLKIKS